MFVFVSVCLHATWATGVRVSMLDLDCSTIPILPLTVQAGHVCGDSVDIVDGRPTGSVRISFGYSSTKGDAERFIKFIKECFVVLEPCPSDPQSSLYLDPTSLADGEGPATAAGE